MLRGITFAEKVGADQVDVALFQTADVDGFKRKLTLDPRINQMLELFFANPKP